MVNSAATAASLAPWYEQAGRGLPPLAVAPLGVPAVSRAAPQPGLQPYFVSLGTIEPRKNHLLLLNLWRQLAAQHGPDTPQLLLLGRRGWKREHPGHAGPVRGAARPGDRNRAVAGPRIRRLLGGARALLFPSFAEGYGLPLAEALALGVPAICSALPALQEVGGAVPDYLILLDGVAWRRAVLDHAAEDSPARKAQLARLLHWQPPRWEDHFAILEPFLAGLAERRAGHADATRREALPAPLALAHP